MSRVLQVKLHFHVHNIPPLYQIPIQLDPDYTLTPCFLKVHFNTVLPSTYSLPVPFIFL